MDRHLIVVYVEGGVVQAVYVNGVDAYDVRVIDIDDNEADTIYPPMPLEEISTLTPGDIVRDALDRSMECPNVDEHREYTERGHGLCPRCLTRPLSCDPNNDDPHEICDHCNWEDEEPA